MYRAVARRVGWTVFTLVTWATLGLSSWLHPDPRGFGTHQQLGLPPCRFRASSGLPCPGCGLTTSFAHMAHGQPLAALRAHLMGPLLFAFVVVLAMYGPCAVVRGRPLRELLEARAVSVWLMLAACAGVLTFLLRVVHVLPVPG